MLLSRARGSWPLLLAVLAVGCGLQTGGLTDVIGTGTGGSPSSVSTSMPAGTGGTAATTTSGHGTGGSGTGGSGTGGHATGVGGHDTGGADAGTGDTGDAGPTSFTSCKDLLAAHPGTPNGVQTLVDAKQQPYQAYCEMVGDSGGWTLILKIDGTEDTFNYDADYWLKGGGLHPDKPDLDTKEAQLPSYWSVPFTQVRAGMIDANTTRWLVLSLQSTSFLDAVNNGGSTSAGRSAWEGLVASGSLQTNCNWEGLNRQALLRFGIVGDESFGCGISSSPDSFIGYGAKSSLGAPSGNTAHYSPDNGDRDTKTFGYLMVR
jgi:hypothetical protein